MKVEFLTFLVIILSVTSQQSSQNTLKFVFEMFRHGARAPYILVNSTTDIFGNNWLGVSQLTNSGIRQHYLIGYQMRQKYIVNNPKFLSQNYSLDNVLAYTTADDRCIMSAYSQLTGLYPPGTGKELNAFQQGNAVPPVNVSSLENTIYELKSAALPYTSQVEPIHNFNKRDYFFHIGAANNCKGVSSIVDQHPNKQMFVDFKNNLLARFPNLQTQFPNLDFGKLNGNNSMYMFFDSFYSAYFDQRDFSKFFNTTEVADLANLAQEFLGIQMYNYQFNQIKDYFLSRNAASPTIHKLIYYFDEIIKSFTNKTEDPNQFVVLYGGHDNDIAPFLTTLNLTFNLGLKQEFVPFAANIFVEFYVNDVGTSDSDYTVNVLYNGNSILQENFKTFKEKIKPNLISYEETQEFCRFESKTSSVDNDDNDHTYLAVVISLGVIALILVIVLIVLLVNKKKWTNTQQDNAVPLTA